MMADSLHQLLAKRITQRTNANFELWCATRVRMHVWGDIPAKMLLVFAGINNSIRNVLDDYVHSELNND
jgi:hypothetical protein